MWEALKEMPCLAFPLNFIALIMNVIFPGTGTMLASFFFNGCSKAMFIIGIIQAMTSVFIVGWVWSFYWGYLLCTNKKKDDHQLLPNKDDTNRDHTADIKP